MRLFWQSFKHSVRTISHTIQMSSFTSKAPSAALSTTILAAGARPTMLWNSKSMLTQREDPDLCEFWKTLSFVAAVAVGVQINNLLLCKLSLEFILLASWPSDKYLGLMDGWTDIVVLVRCKLTTRPIVGPEGLLELEDKCTLLKLGCLQSFNTLVESVVMSSKQKLSVERWNPDEFLRRKVLFLAFKQARKKERNLVRNFTFSS